MTRARSRAAAPASVDTGVSSAEPSTGIGFGTPPSTRGRYDWAAIAETCKAQPGEWYKVFEQQPRTTALAVQQGSVRMLVKSNGFEVKTTNNRTDVNPRLCDMWIRYVPQQDQSRKRRKN